MRSVVQNLNCVPGVKQCASRGCKQNNIHSVMGVLWIWAVLMCVGGGGRNRGSLLFASLYAITHSKVQDLVYVNPLGINVMQTGWGTIRLRTTSLVICTASQFLLPWICEPWGCDVPVPSSAAGSTCPSVWRTWRPGERGHSCRHRGWMFLDENVHTVFGVASQLTESKFISRIFWWLLTLSLTLDHRESHCYLHLLSKPATLWRTDGRASVCHPCVSPTDTNDTENIV